jgi:hypothetical protein
LVVRVIDATDERSNMREAVLLDGLFVVFRVVRFRTRGRVA